MTEQEKYNEEAKESAPQDIKLIPNWKVITLYIIWIIVIATIVTLSIKLSDKTEENHKLSKAYEAKQSIEKSLSYKKLCQDKIIPESDNNINKQQKILEKEWFQYLLPTNYK